MSLEQAYSQLDWPLRSQIEHPTGAGAKIYAQLVEEKIGRVIRLRSDVKGLRTGVLTPNSSSDSTQAPLAIVCEFSHPASTETIKATHKLSWSFSRSPLLITVEPHLVRAWTCCEPPTQDDTSPEIPQAQVRLDAPNTSLSAVAAQSLHWVQLVSGEFFRDHEPRFRRERCADQMLLSNLKAVREKLRIEGLQHDDGDDIIHDLLARIIFIQFLFDRKDSNGNPALSESKLLELHDNKTLSKRYRSLAEILKNHEDTYSLFRWLNGIFNGDLFPGKGVTDVESENDWRREMKRVQQAHLDLLSQFVSGDIDMGKEQPSFWPYYSFDAIPLEFISSIYEEFVEKKAGVHYTPSHLVDFILDGVLPWDSIDWDKKVLDPACGSGIFLVKAFQRLVYRWKKAHPNQPPDAQVLCSLLDNNLFGIDTNEHAVRVASFSLYLAMCDELDPRNYWDQLHFPVMRGKRLIAADFFAENVGGFRTCQDIGIYDLVVGNAPWGKDTVREGALVQGWAAGHCDQGPWSQGAWPIPNKSIGPLFLIKAASLTDPKGYVSMLQPASTLLFNRESTAESFRQKLFSIYKVQEVVNLAALRFVLFSNAVGTACVITLRPTEPDGEPITYLCPKPILSSEDKYRIVIEPHDVHAVRPQEAVEDSQVWSAFMWGGRRDYAFIRRLNQQNNLAQLEENGKLARRKGIVRGNKLKQQPKILNRRIIETAEFPAKTFIHLKAGALNINEDAKTESASSTNMVPFELPQLLVKKSWQAKTGRFQAAIVQSDEETGGVICSQSYVSIHVPKEHYSNLEAAWLSFNSRIAVYYLLLTSGRFASYIHEPLVEELLSVPIPDARPDLLTGLMPFDWDGVDSRVRKAFAINDAEWILIEDLVKYTLPDFKGSQSSPGRRKTQRELQKNRIEGELELRNYCEYFVKVLKAGFGQDKNVCATIFEEGDGTKLPVRLVAIQLDWPERAAVTIESDSPELRNRLKELNTKILQRSEDSVYQRVARIYEEVGSVPTIFLIKPDQVRYWTRSSALRDADEVAADIMLWRGTTDVTESDERGADYA